MSQPVLAMFSKGIIFTIKATVNFSNSSNFSVRLFIAKWALPLDWFPVYCSEFECNLYLNEAGGVTPVLLVMDLYLLYRR